MGTKDEKKPVRPKIQVTINKDLDNYEGRILFPEKLAKSNEMLRTIGIPEDFKHQKSNKL